MKSLIINSIAIVFLVWIFTSCDSKPRVIVADDSTDNYSGTSMVKETSLVSKTNSTTSATTHEVKVEDVLNTDKYSYLKVSGKEEPYWIAIAKADVQVGQTYFYRGGLLKKNFFSREFNRVFETLYLVSNFWEKTNEAPQKGMASKIPTGHGIPDLKIEKINPVDGAISLQQLFSNMPMYDDTKVKITGKCVKVNPKIMNRNWLHIQDGSGEGLDLTVTTQEEVPLGAVVSLEGTIAVDKDFGAGYRYDIIMEGAVLK